MSAERCTCWDEPGTTECPVCSKLSAPSELSSARGSAAGGNGGAQDQPEKKWCAWCGVWGDHTSGGCDDLHDALLRRRAEDEKQPNARADLPRIDDANREAELQRPIGVAFHRIVSLRLLDLFCCAGGAGEGYRRAGFDVTGVDIKPQKNNPHKFIQADALEYVAAHGHEYDAIHASPPCQAYSMAAQTQRNLGKVYPDLLAATRCALEKTGKPWVIENVPGAPMRADFKLCGCQFGMKLRRERWFETSWNGMALIPSCHHPFPVVSVVGHGTPTWVREKLGYNPTIKDYREAMGIDWMNRDELSQAIPPNFTEYIGRYLLAQVKPSNIPS